MKQAMHTPARVARAFLLLLLSAGAAAYAQSADAELTQALRERVDLGKKSVGIVAGVIDAQGTRVLAYGKPTATATAAVDGNTVFEIGSVSKVFTATLLADMVGRGEVALSDPISKYLPASVKTPARNGKQITLLDLATQTSGLPRMPNNLTPQDKQNPYADYTPEQLYAFLSGYELTRDIGDKFEYSNLGVGLLGHILGLAARSDYATLVKTRIADPLGMRDTAVVLTAAQQARLAPGHNRTLGQVPGWDFSALAGAGALRSTVNDMLKFLAANLDATAASTGLAAAMHNAQTARHEAGQPDMQIGLNWMTLKKFDAEIVWHNGQTTGYHAFLGFDKKQRKGIVLLSNSTNDTDDIGRHFLVAAYPLATMTAPPVAIALDAAVLERCVGIYQFPANGPQMTVTRDGAKLFVQLTGQGKLEVLAKSETDFFMTVADVQILFGKDGGGKIDSLVLRQNGRDQKASKL